uniref:helix-turn-helix domain-containing protein n=1 Tax=Pseudomonas aeruginosa TaxID=287 RepID=UPI00066BE496
MPIEIRLDVMLALRKARSKDLAQAIGITEQNLSLFKQGKVKGIRLATLEPKSGMTASAWASW